MNKANNKVPPVGTVVIYNGDEGRVVKVKATTVVIDLDDYDTEIPHAMAAALTVVGFDKSDLEWS